jgi:hypothetical protein
MQGETDVSPPESLVKFEAPLYVGDSGGAKPPPDKGGASQIDEILNSILPPREWQEESGTWMQYTAKTPATRLDVINLQVNAIQLFMYPETVRNIFFTGTDGHKAHGSPSP